MRKRIKGYVLVGSSSDAPKIKKPVVDKIHKEVHGMFKSCSMGNRYSR